VTCSKVNIIFAYIFDPVGSALFLPIFLIP